MLESKVLKKMKEKKPVLCVKTNFNDPNIIELMGLMGFDCVWICKEHLWANDETMAHMIMAARCTGMDALVRIEKASYVSAIRYLEMGAKGIMVPHVTSCDEASQWVKNTKFYPIGRRGIDGANADSGWMSMEFTEYLKFSNKETFLVVQIEDPEAIPNIEKIAQVPNLDMIFVGIGDLSTSLGFPREIDRKEIWNVLERVAKAADKYGVFIGAPGVSKEYTKRLIDMGYLFIANGADVVFLRNSFSKLKEEYRELGFSFR